MGLLTHFGRKIIATAHAEDPSLLRVLVGSHMSLNSSHGIEVITPVVRSADVDEMGVCM